MPDTFGHKTAVTRLGRALPLRREDIEG